MPDVFIDNTKETATLTGADWQFSNGSGTVTETGALGNAQAEVAIGNYIRTNGGIQWYKVLTITDDDNIEVTPNFQQGTNTDTCKLNSEDGTAVGSEYAHHNQALTDTNRAAGDIVKTRVATYTYAGVDIVVDDDATVSNRLTLKGASIADDPWSDASDVRPIIDFAETNNDFNLLFDDYWTIEHLAFTNSTSTIAVNISIVDGLIIDDCKFYGNGNGTGDSALRLNNSPGAIIRNCIFDNNFGVSLDMSSQGLTLIEGCTFDGDTVGGGNGTNYGLDHTGMIYIRDCIFGATSAHAIADIRIGGGYIHGRNNKLNSPTEIATLEYGNHVIMEDDEQTHLAFRYWQFTGDISRTVTVNRSGAGGTSWSILGEPNSNCTLYESLYIIGDWLDGVPIYLDGTEQTITMWAYADSTGGTWTPNASEFLFELEYYNGVADWQVEVTTDTFAAENQWESFTITITPGAAGPAYLRAALRDYSAGGKIYIDPHPVFT